jgi:exopolysaccharide biosynthesis protein
VWTGAEWREWWRSSEAPVRWIAPDAALARALRWRPAAAGVEWAVARLAGSGEAWRTRVIVARVDPQRVRLRLDTAFTRGGRRAAWSLAAARPEAVFAVNAGQFVHTLPWGWVVLDGRQFLPPGPGPLATTVVIDSAGGIHWVPADDLADSPARGGAAFAFQSYPTLLSADGTVPHQLRGPGAPINLGHRDARLAIGQMRDGTLLVALTRFDGAGTAFEFVPFGLTAPEMAAVMGALGARDAVMLDGGISSQMQIGAGSDAARWTGLRKVPLALVAVPR